MRKKDKPGLYRNGEFITDSFLDAGKEIKKGQKGLSIIDSKGIQHILELSEEDFYVALMEMDINY